MNDMPMRRAKWLIGAMLALLTIVALGLLEPLSPRPAKGLDNPAEDRMAMVAEMRKANERLDRIIALLESGKVKVALSNAEELKGAAPAASGQKEAGRPEKEEESKIIIMQKEQP